MSTIGRLFRACVGIGSNAQQLSEDKVLNISAPDKEKMLRVLCVKKPRRMYHTTMVYDGPVWILRGKNMAPFAGFLLFLSLM